MNKALHAGSDWSDKDELLDVVYWGKQRNHHFPFCRLFFVLVKSHRYIREQKIFAKLFISIQILSLIIGVTFGAASMHGILAILAYVVISTMVAQHFVVKYQQVDEDEVGGFWELAKEGFGSAFATFMVAWITVYSALYHNS
ncbi:unnamed protein product [Strongylus vulgaris]|uniref:Rab5-interacting protein n=1 Tax=Strongylus vulgaris TaxID=40348 RepID=A0A3P7IJM9_STRVU|nr:unnamed protein product [Strongylus vulgaris]